MFYLILTGAVAIALSKRKKTTYIIILNSVGLRESPYFTPVWDSISGSKTELLYLIFTSI